MFSRTDLRKISKKVLFVDVEPERPLGIQRARNERRFDVNSIREDRKRVGGFRALLCGISRNVAQRVEQRQYAHACKHKTQNSMKFTPAKMSLSRAIDRAAWTVQLLKAAGVRHPELAAAEGPEAVRRVEMLRQRFRDEKPVREIAMLRQLGPEHLLRKYKKPRTVRDD